MSGWIAINDSASAEPVLNAIHPDIYVKGADYRDAKEDVTGRIVAEQEAVEAQGGKVVFTDDIVFSSSALINKYLDIYEPPLQEYLDTMRAAAALDQVKRVVAQVADYRVLIIGDAIIDEYRYVMPLGKSPKENMIATILQGSETFAGGVFAAANHAASFCREVEILTCLGQRDSFVELISGSLKSNIRLTTIDRADAPTTRKIRYIDHSYSMRKLFEVYSMDDRPLAPAEENRLHHLLKDKIDSADVVVVTDFGHGLVGPRTIELLAERARFLGVNAQSNSANHGFNLITRYPRADYVCVDGPEARMAVGDKYSDLTAIASEVLPSRMACESIVITSGKHGCFAYRRGEGVTHVPALTNTIVDTVGAGDAFFAVTAPMVATGAPMPLIGLLGNAAGAMKVGILGHRSSVERVPFLKFLTALLK